MFKKILIANRGDNGAAFAAQPERMARAARAGNLAAGVRDV